MLEYNSGVKQPKGWRLPSSSLSSPLTRKMPLGCILLLIFSTMAALYTFTAHPVGTKIAKVTGSLQLSEDEFDVCLVMRVGDAAEFQAPSKKNLPFILLPRLFEEVQRLMRTLRAGATVCVSVDYSDIACKMVRDSLGSETKCWNTTQIQQKMVMNTSQMGLFEMEALAVEVHNLSFAVGLTVFTTAYDSQVRCKDTVIGRTRRYLTQTDNILATVLENTHFVDLDTPDPRDEPPKLRASKVQPTIVTGFSSNHLPSGLLFLRSIGKAVQEARSNMNQSSGRSDFRVPSVVVWAMEKFTGADANDLRCVVRELNLKWNVQAEVRDFDFSALPDWMQIDQTLGWMGGTGEYAWKAIMIHRILVERGFVLWQDAGCRYKTSQSLVQSLDHVSQHGFASRITSGSIKDWTFPAQLQFLRASTVDLSQSNCDGSSVGFTLKRYKELVRPWYQCSLTRQCIAPDGSDRSNHRQDQAALTVLAALTKNKCEGIPPEVGRHMDNHDESLVGVESTTCYQDPRDKNL